ncbi:phytanoyl-CoA dioxygenase family protein [Streptomyces sp. NPDC050535]|uniref:phytanoyl-CoA dioxygenase family protein n=1 Tax=Streptomyces sp. NPDC050535 TaxID=3365626 RepID=UPI00378A9198
MGVRMKVLPGLAPQEYGDPDSWLVVLRQFGVAAAPAWTSSQVLHQLLAEHRRVFLPADKSAAPPSDSRAVSEVAYRPGIASRAVRLTTATAHALPRTRAFLQDAVLAAVAAAYLGADASINQFAYLTLDVPHATPVTALHYDRKHALKAYLCLTPADEGWGAPAFVPGTHHHSRSVRQAHLAAGVPEELLPITQGHQDYTTIGLQGPPGTLVLFDTDCLHQGGAVAAGHTRRVLRGHSHPGPRAGSGTATAS